MGNESSSQGGSRGIAKPSVASRYMDADQVSDSSIEIDEDTGQVIRRPIGSTSPAAGRGKLHLGNRKNEDEERQRELDVDAIREKYNIPSSSTAEISPSEEGSTLCEEDKVAELERPGCIVHKVVRSDTISGLALQYETDASLIKKNNNLWNERDIHMKDYLSIPVNVAQYEKYLNDQEAERKQQWIVNLAERIGVSNAVAEQYMEDNNWSLKQSLAAYDREVRQQEKEARRNDALRKKNEDMGDESSTVSLIQEVLESTLGSDEQAGNVRRLNNNTKKRMEDEKDEIFGL